MPIDSVYNISWELPDHNQAMQEIDYYEVRVNDGPLILHKASFTLHGQGQPFCNISITAIDECGIKGQEFILDTMNTSQSSDFHNGAKGGV